MKREGVERHRNLLPKYSLCMKQDAVRNVAEQTAAILQKIDSETKAKVRS